MKYNKPIKILTLSISNKKGIRLLVIPFNFICLKRELWYWQQRFRHHFKKVKPAHIIDLTWTEDLNYKITEDKYYEPRTKK